LCPRVDLGVDHGVLGAQAEVGQLQRRAPVPRCVLVTGGLQQPVRDEVGEIVGACGVRQRHGSERELFGGLRELEPLVAVAQEQRGHDRRT
jgi:hypothetical protein